jgi:hypothetical protein
MEIFNTNNNNTSKIFDLLSTLPDVTGRPKRSSRTATTRRTACSPCYHPEGEVSIGALTLET